MNQPEAQAVELSVFITTYNRAATLAETLRRLVLALDPGRVEIVVHDDGSTDDTAMVCAAMPAHVRYVQLDRNQGLIRARAGTLRHASADLVLVLDDDSYVVDSGVLDRIQWVCAAHPNAAIVAANVASREIPFGVDDPEAAPYQTASFIGCGHVVRRAAFGDEPLYPPFLAGYGSEETALSLRLLDEGWIIVFDPALRIWHAEDPSGRPSTQRMASLFVNEVAMMAGLFPTMLCIPLAIWKLGAHWKRNWSGRAGAVLRLIRRHLPARLVTALRSRRPVKWSTLWRFRRLRQTSDRRRAEWRARSLHAGETAGTSSPVRSARSHVPQESPP